MLTIVSTSQNRHVLIKDDNLYIIYIKKAWVSGTVDIYTLVNIVEVLFQDEGVGSHEGIFRSYKDELSYDHILNRLSKELLKHGSIIEREYKGGYDVD